MNRHIDLEDDMQAPVLTPSEQTPPPDPLSDERQEHILELVCEYNLAVAFAEDMFRLTDGGSRESIAAGAHAHSVRRRLTELLMEAL